MTVAELIEELKRLPQHHPILCDVGLRYNESIFSATSGHADSRTGPYVVIHTVSDSRNYPSLDEEYGL